MNSIRENSQDGGEERPSAHDHKETTTICKTTIIEKVWNLSEKIFYN